MRLASIYRYPVKGLSPEPLDAVDLIADGYFPGDRLFAFENGPSGFDPAAPEHQPKIKFLMLMKNAALAGLTTRYDLASNELSVIDAGREVARANVSDPAERGALERFFMQFLGEAIRGPVRLLAAPQGFRFTDSKSGFVSLVNLASLADLEQAAGAPVDPLRFRANLYVADAAPWIESTWPGRRIGIGGSVLEILKMTDRCAATGVAPGTGARDMDLVQTLRAHYGHIDCGVYARIVTGGRVATGDALDYFDS